MKNDVSLDNFLNMLQGNPKFNTMPDKSVDQCFHPGMREEPVENKTDQKLNPALERLRQLNANDQTNNIRTHDKSKLYELNKDFHEYSRYIKLVKFKKF
jgi:hypothetical protein